MHKAQNDLLEMHKKMHQTIGDPRSPNLQADQELRIRLIEEELKELYLGLEAGDVANVAKELADLIYVLVGSAIAWGIDLASVWDEVHRSNMSKNPDNKRADGKVLKGPEYSPANIEAVLKDAAENFDCSEDGWWEEPTVSRYKCGECADTGCVIDPDVKIAPTEGDYLKDCPKCEPSPQVTENIMMAARDQAKILAARELPAEMVPELHKTATVIEHSDGVPKGIKGEMTAYGAYVFDCTGCGRRHAVQARMGSRGGLADFANAECICGKAYLVDFRDMNNIKITETTIEELRKDS